MIRFVVWFAFVMTVTIPSFCQFKNIPIGIPGSAYDPGIAINPKNPKNLAVVSAPDHIFYTLDAGASWQASKLNSPWGIYGGVTILADNKGDFYALYLSDESGEGLKNDKCLDYVVCQVSKDGGKTWEEANAVGYAPSKDQIRIGAAVDGKEN